MATINLTADQWELLDGSTPDDRADRPYAAAYLNELAARWIINPDRQAATDGFAAATIGVSCGGGDTETREVFHRLHTAWHAV